MSSSLVNFPLDSLLRALLISVAIGHWTSGCHNISYLHFSLQKDNLITNMLITFPFLIMVTFSLCSMYIQITTVHPGQAHSLAVCSALRSFFSQGHSYRIDFWDFFYFINLLHGARSQSVADYLQQVAYSFRGLRGQKPPL